MMIRSLLELLQSLLAILQRFEGGHGSAKNGVRSRLTLRDGKPDFGSTKVRVNLFNKGDA